MNYKIWCPTCGKKVKVSTRDAVKGVNKNTLYVTLTFPCPNCNAFIHGLLPNIKKE